MMTLHLINRSPLESHALEQCLARVGEGDAVLLIEDAVLAAKKNPEFDATLASALGQVRVYVLGPDLDARGVGTSEVDERARMIDYGGFVDLTAAYRLIQSWF